MKAGVRSNQEESRQLIPFVTHPEANADILIYEGAMKYKIGFEAFQAPDAEGKAFYNWFPYPRVMYQFRLLESHGTVFSTEPTIEHEGLGQPTIFWKTFEDAFHNIKGFVEEYESSGKDLLFDRLQFQFANLKPFGKDIGDGPMVSNRLTFTLGDFVIELQHQLFQEEKELLQKSGGYLLTGIAEISKHSDKIHLEEAEKIMSVFTEFLSFFNALKVRPLFITGVVGGQAAYRKYKTVTEVDTFIGRFSWIPQRIDETEMDKTWQRFYVLWQEEEDKDCLQLAVHWYIEAFSMKSGMEASITLIQNALELLCSRILVEKEKILDAGTSEKMVAFSKINVLLNWAQVPNMVPADSYELVKLAKSDNLATGPEVITHIRNSIVHPHVKNRKKYRNLSLASKRQALMLALNYVELVLLKLLHYNGVYYNRNFNKQALLMYMNQRVPWVKIDENKSP